MKRIKQYGAALAVGVSVFMLVGLMPLSAAPDAAETAGATALSADASGGTQEPVEGTPESTASEAIETPPPPGEEPSTSQPPQEENGGAVSDAQSETSGTGEPVAPVPAATDIPSSSSSETMADMLEEDEEDEEPEDTFDETHLQQLVDDASAGENVVLPGDFILGGTVTINKPLTIGGQNGAPVSITLAEGYSGRHFVVDAGAGKITLQFMNITGHTNMATGGGIQVTGGGEVEMQNLALSYNFNPGGNGGAIYSGSASSYIDMIQCTVQNNAALQGGGAFSLGTLNPTQGTTFISNQAVGGNGGGLYAAISNGDSAVFHGNRASGNGGGAYLANTGASGSGISGLMYGGEFVGNEATNGGGLATISGGRTRMQYVTFENNAASQNGGALWENGGELYIEGCTIQNNRAQNAGGGAYGTNHLHFENGSYVGHNKAAYGGGAATEWGIQIEDYTTFESNHATIGGGGVHNLSSEGMVALDKSTFRGNTTDGDMGGAVFLTLYENLYCNYVTFEDNRSARGTYWEIVFPDDPRYDTHQYPNQFQADVAERYPNTIVGNTPTVPFTNIYNCWDVTFYYAAFTYFVTLEPGEGSWADTGSSDSRQIIVEEGGKVELPAEVKKSDGDDPVGWYTDAALTKRWNMDNVVTGDMTLFAKYEYDFYDVRFELDGTQIDERKNIQEGTLVPNPPTPNVGDGFVFDGWYSDEALTQPFNVQTDTVEGNMTLYARSKDDGLVDIKYILDGGIYGREDDLVPPAKLTPPETEPTKKGYIFLGWFEKDADTAWDFGTTTSDDVTLYARFKQDNLVDITYMVDGDENPYYIDKDVVIGEKLDKPKDPPAEKGFEFDGWFRNEERTLPWDYENDVAEDDTILHAGFVPVYDVVYVADGAVHHQDPGLRCGALLTPPAAPKKDGHSFNGWYRGTMDDLPQDFAVLSTRATAAPLAEEIEIIYWIFESDAMPEELVVLVADFAADPVVDPSTSNGGSGGSTSVVTEPRASVSSSSSSTGTGSSSTSRTSGTAGRTRSTSGSGVTGSGTRTSGAQTADHSPLGRLAGIAIFASLAAGALHMFKRKKSHK